MCRLYANCSSLAFLFLLVVLCVTPQVARGDFDPGPLVREAATMLEQGQVLQSAAAWDQLYQLARDPDLRALALVRQGDLAALFQNAPAVAMTLYDRAIREFQGSPALENAWCNGAMLRYEAGELAAARQAFARCAELFPESPRAQTARFMEERLARELAGPAPRLPDSPQAETLQEEPVVRVRLELAERVRLQLPHGGHLLLPDGGYETLNAGDLEVVAEGGKLLLQEYAYLRPRADAVVLPARGGFIWQGVRYPGEAGLHIHKGQVLLVNRLPLESYLWGVVPAEMPASFAPEALKAQAVASRSYALALLRGRKFRPWDLLASKLSQVYKGVRNPAERVKQAVTATEGEVLIHEGRPVLSYFHSHSGGMLEDDAAVWNGDLPFYAAREDPASNSQRSMDWSLEISCSELARKLAREGVRVSSISGAETLTRTASGRIGTVRLTTPDGPVDIKGTLLRRAVGTVRMKSTLADIAPAGSGCSLRITGRGFGHGVGMSQWGAQGLALEGQGYKAILAHYYPQVAVERLW